MFFKKEINLISSSTVNEIINRLENITEKYHTNSSDKYKFEGKIDSDSFLLRPTFDFGPRQQLRPEIKGKVENKNGKSLIKLEFKLPNEFLYILVLLMNLSVMIYLFFNPIKNETFFSWKFFAIGIPFIVLIFINNFNSKITKSIKILSSILEVKI